MTVKKKILVSLVAIAFIAIIAYGVIQFMNKTSNEDEQVYQALLAVFMKYDSGALGWLMPYMAEQEALDLEEYYRLGGEKSKAGAFVATVGRKYTLDTMRTFPGFHDEFFNIWNGAREQAAIRKAKG